MRGPTLHVNLHKIKFYIRWPYGIVSPGRVDSSLGGRPPPGRKNFRPGGKSIDTRIDTRLKILENFLPTNFFVIEKKNLQLFFFDSPKVFQIFQTCIDACIDRISAQAETFQIPPPGRDEVMHPPGRIALETPSDPHRYERVSMSSGPDDDAYDDLAALPQSARYSRSRSPSPNKVRSRSKSVPNSPPLRKRHKKKKKKKKKRGSRTRKPAKPISSVGSQVSKRTSVWKFLIKGVFTIEELMKIDVQLEVKSDSDEDEDIDSEDEKEEHECLYDIRESFKQIATRHSRLYCFAKDDSVCADISKNLTLSEHSRDVDNKTLGFDFIYKRIKKLYRLFGGDRLRDFDYPTMCFLASVRYPSSNGFSLTQQSRVYSAVHSRLVVYFHARKFEANDAQKNACYRWLVHIARRIKWLREMRSAGTMMTRLFGHPEGESWCRLTGGMVGDIRASHDISGGSHRHASLIFRSAIATTGARQYEGEIWLPIFVNNVFVNAYEKFVTYKDGRKTSRVEDCLADISGLIEEGNADWERIVVPKLDFIIKAIKSSNNASLPHITLDPNLRSFKNGVYNSLTDEFYPHNSPRIPGVSAAFFRTVTFDPELMDDRFKDPLNFRGGGHRRRVREDDEEEEEEEADEPTSEDPKWFRLVEKHCPNFYKMFAYQFPRYDPKKSGIAYSTYRQPKVCLRFVFAMLGRCLFELNLIESGFERIVALIGIAGVGKSKFLGVLSALVPNHVVIKSNPEEQFGYQQLTQESANLIITDEIDSKSKISQDFVLTVGSSAGKKNSAAKMQVSVKYGAPMQISPKQPLVIVGNSFPQTW